MSVVSSGFPIIAVNRALFVLATIAAVATAAVPWLVPTSVDFARSDKAVQVPRVSDPGVRRLEARAPSRNPFDRAGSRWTPPDDTGEAASIQPDAENANASGVLHIGPLRGVFTGDGFVAVGESFGPGRLKEVAPGRIVVETPDGERVLPLDGSRDQRLETLRKAR
jgi:hypothetical protein